VVSDMLPGQLPEVGAPPQGGGSSSSSSRRSSSSSAGEMEDKWSVTCCMANMDAWQRVLLYINSLLLSMMGRPMSQPAFSTNNPV
jgi:hypothetical protein